ncbi:SH3 domain-containing protein [Kaistella treverensis]|uniref:SH3 domain-containing protein n=1 Tax=Kaistella treverensis TaxID=631455 RepID=A0A1I3MBP8_9FLAO|nr:C40 family peptidase [Kaistella treverensis]SFI94449.1 SH3 domain-containing protein [Kaistella treverensis]
MNKGICTVSVAALRSEPSQRAEMTSQLLYGETIKILANEGKFLKIQMDFDQYEGWVDAQQISEISENENKTIVQETFLNYLTSEGEILLSIGSEIKAENPAVEQPKNIIETAMKFLNVPYLWSGRSFFGIDCSGFVQLVYKVHGIALPRDAYQQAVIGEVLSFVEESRPGDLAFFENSEGQIVHVGILLNNFEIIHAFGKVRIDALDTTGIFNKDLNRHTHKLRFIRNILPNN